MSGFITLPINLDAHIGTDDSAEGAAVALLAVPEYTIVVSGMIEVLRHLEDTSGTCSDTELASLTAFGCYDYPPGTFHNKLLN